VYSKFQSVNQTDNLEETGCKLDSSGSGQNPIAESFKHGNKPSGSIKMENFFDQVCHYQHLKNDHIQCN
jgi:hypothetical protein